MLCFAVVILTHLPIYENNKDVQVLEQLKNALWFILEPLMMKNENFSLQFYKMLLEMMKCHIDASNPPSDILNHVSLLSFYNLLSINLQLTFWGISHFRWITSVYFYKMYIFFRKCGPFVTYRLRLLWARLLLTMTLTKNFLLDQLCRPYITSKLYFFRIICIIYCKV